MGGIRVPIESLARRACGRRRAGNRADLRRRCAADLHALGAAALAGDDLNSGLRDFQTSGQKAAERFIGAIVDGRGGEADTKRAGAFAGSFVARGARLEMDGEQNGAVELSNVNHVCSILGLSAPPLPHPFFVNL